MKTAKQGNEVQNDNVMLPGSDIATIADIVAAILPKSELKEFRVLYLDAPKAFWNYVWDFVSQEELKQAVLDRAIEQLEYLESRCGIEVDAIVNVAGKRCAVGNLFQEYEA